MEPSSGDGCRLLTLPRKFRDDIYEHSVVARDYIVDSQTSSLRLIADYQRNKEAARMSMDRKATSNIEAYTTLRWFPDSCATR